MTAVGATAVGVTEVRNNLELEMIINIGSTILLRMILVLPDVSLFYLIDLLLSWELQGPNIQTHKQTNRYGSE